MNALTISDVAESLEGLPFTVTEDAEFVFVHSKTTEDRLLVKQAYEALKMRFDPATREIGVVLTPRAGFDLRVSKRERSSVSSFIYQMQDETRRLDRACAESAAPFSVRFFVGGHERTFYAYVEVVVTCYRNHEKCVYGDVNEAEALVAPLLGKAGDGQVWERGRVRESLTTDNDGSKQYKGVLVFRTPIS